MVHMGEEEARTTLESKGRTNSNIPTGPNKAVRVATLYYYCIYRMKIKGQQSRSLLSTHSSLQPKLAGRRSDAMKYGNTSMELA